MSSSIERKTWVPGLLFILAALLGPVAWIGYENNAAWEREAITATGTLEVRRQEIPVLGSITLVKCRFVDRNGNPQNVIVLTTGEHVEDGATVRVRYAPARSYDFRIAEMGRNENWFVVTGGFASAFLIVALIVLTVNAAVRRRESTQSRRADVPPPLTLEHYAGFWPRVLAYFVDAVVLSAVLAPLAFGKMFFHSWAPLSLVEGLVPAAYHIYCHGRWGMTPGKRAAGIRVARPDGAPLGWSRAWLRSSVELAGGFLGGGIMAYAWSSVPAAEFGETGVLFRGTLAARHIPVWYWWAAAPIMVWTLSEPFVALANDRRRALHDFLAGTVVLKRTR